MNYFKNKLFTDPLKCLNLIFPKTDTEKMEILNSYAVLLRFLRTKRVKLRLKNY